MHLQDSFDPKTLTLLRHAYAKACHGADVTQRTAADGPAQELRLTLVRRIMSLAARGERDVDALIEHALKGGLRRRN